MRMFSNLPKGLLRLALCALLPSMLLRASDNKIDEDAFVERCIKFLSTSRGQWGPGEEQAIIAESQKQGPGFIPKLLDAAAQWNQVGGQGVSDFEMEERAASLAWLSGHMGKQEIIMLMDKGGSFWDWLRYHAPFEVLPLIKEIADTEPQTEAAWRASIFLVQKRIDHPGLTVKLTEAVARATREDIWTEAHSALSRIDPGALTLALERASKNPKASQALRSEATEYLNREREKTRPGGFAPRQAGGKSLEKLPSWMQVASAFGISLFLGILYLIFMVGGTSLATAMAQSLVIHVLAITLSGLGLIGSGYIQSLPTIARAAVPSFGAVWLGMGIFRWLRCFGRQRTFIFFLAFAGASGLTTHLFSQNPMWLEDLGRTNTWLWQPRALVLVPIGFAVGALVRLMWGKDANNGSSPAKLLILLISLFPLTSAQADWPGSDDYHMNRFMDGIVNDDLYLENEGREYLKKRPNEVSLILLTRAKAIQGWPDKVERAQKKICDICVENAEPTAPIVQGMLEIGGSCVWAIRGWNRPEVVTHVKQVLKTSIDPQTSVNAAVVLAWRDPSSLPAVDQKQARSLATEYANLVLQGQRQEAKLIVKRLLALGPSAIPIILETAPVGDDVAEQDLKLRWLQDDICDVSRSISPLTIETTRRLLAVSWACLEGGSAVHLNPGLNSQLDQIVNGTDPLEVRARAAVYLSSSASTNNTVREQVLEEAARTIDSPSLWSLVAFNLPSPKREQVAQETAKDLERPSAIREKAKEYSQLPGREYKTWQKAKAPSGWESTLLHTGFLGGMVGERLIWQRLALILQWVFFWFILFYERGAAWRPVRLGLLLMGVFNWISVWAGISGYYVLGLVRATTPGGENALKISLVLGAPIALFAKVGYMNAMLQAAQSAKLGNLGMLFVLGLFVNPFLNIIIGIGVACLFIFFKRWGRAKSGIARFGDPLA